MDEPAARRVILVQAIETADRDGKLVSEAERGQIDRVARDEAHAEGATGGPVAAGRFLDLRARRILQAVAGRNPAIVSLQAVPAWRAWLVAGTPFATLLLGALTERIADPHRVDLLSLPLLAIVLWNVLVYLVLIVSGLLPRRRRAHPLTEALGRWVDSLHGWRGRSGQLRADVTALFFVSWQRATAALQLQRATGTLHLAALGWGAGVAVSLLVQGLVVQYRVGWESTFLGARQVHAILSFLLMPVVALFPFQPFSVQEVAALQLGPGDISRADPRWVWMYAALLLVVVIVPRAVLALFAFWRAKVLARRIPVDLGEPYFGRLVSLLTPARVQLCLLTHRAADRAALLRVLVQEPETGRVLISSSNGDTLRFVDVSGCAAPPVPQHAHGSPPDWVDRVLRSVSRTRGSASGPAGDAVLTQAHDEGDVALHVVGESGDLDAGRPLLQWLDKPVLVLLDPAGALAAPQPDLASRARSEARSLALVTDVLSFDAFGRCWVQERVLLDAIARCLPPAKAPGFARIAAAWEGRNRERFGRSMTAIAEHLLFAARQVQEVPSAALSLSSLVSPAQRQAQAQARQAAMDAVVRRLEVSAAQMFAALQALHAIDDAAAGALQHRFEEKFVVQQAVDTPQAGLAGAATGAAMGASVDLLVGGLTLGAATALGAFVGGSAAFIAAAWKNRATPTGATIVQLSDEMMQAMVEAALLRYLAVAHDRGPASGGGELQPSWKSEVVAAVQAHHAWLAPCWNAARAQPDAAQAGALARELETIAQTLLETFYPAQTRAA